MLHPGVKGNDDDDDDDDDNSYKLEMLGGLTMNLETLILLPISL